MHFPSFSLVDSYKELQVLFQKNFPRILRGFKLRMVSSRRPFSEIKTCANIPGAPLFSGHASVKDGTEIYGIRLHSYRLNQCTCPLI
jgi:hypothetical protein